MIERELIKSINSGNCILFVGSGTSCSAGLPSWEQLVAKIILIITAKSLIEEKAIATLQNYYHEKNFPECLELISRELGRDRLISLISSVFEQSKIKDSEAYQILAGWPFKFYLTTNYDSLLKEYLSKNDVAVLEKKNNKTDFLTLNNRARNVIYKIHGDFEDPHNMVVTSSDYKKICEEEDFAYWREKIGSLFHMFTIILIGYSAKDPDFIEQLERIKGFVDPNNPIFMVVSDLSKNEIDELEKLNIRILKYNNEDGTHKGLSRLLELYDHFIQRRNDPLLGKIEIDSCETEMATSLYLYNQLVLRNISVINRALCNVLLKVFPDNSEPLPLEIIAEKIKKCGIACDDYTLLTSLNELVTEKYIYQDPRNMTFSIVEAGKNLISETKADSNLKKEHFDQYCKIQLEKKNLNQQNIKIIMERLNEGLVVVFRKRGVEIANKIFNDGTVSFSSSTDLLGDLNNFASSQVLDTEEYLGFIELLIDLFEHPSIEVQEYLGMLVNGYFMYHVLGQDKKARDARREDLVKRKMFVDSSVMISSLAKGSINHLISNDLLKMLGDNGIQCMCTEHLLQEVVDHAIWALRNYGRSTVSSLEYFGAALGSSNQRENLFVNGSVKWSIGKGPAYLNEYFLEIFKTDNINEIYEATKTLLEGKGILIIDIKDFIEDSSATQIDLEEQTDLIISNRKSKDTYRSDVQCKTEAELIIFSKNEPINFLTRSTSLIELADNMELGNWPPETLYRFLGLNSSDIDLPSMYNCMLGDLSLAGFNIIEKETLSKFVGPLFSQARLELEKQKNEFKEVLSEFITEESMKNHEMNLTLPFFALQTAFYAAKAAKTKLDETTEIMKGLKQTSKLDSTERLEYERMKSKKKERQKRQQNKRKKKRKKN